ncbi:MAG: YidC/Oxa1 family membrane protein insertase [Clostridia bacterium]|nr:YidC/Oxa1 family membrane protein insertase [Clostridia bacterium]
MDLWSYLIVPFAWIMQQCMNLLNNYALALIAYALITKIIIFPLSMKQQKSQLNMVRLRPYQDALKKKYGNNQERYNQELQKLYQREGINPMGSCLPLLIQLPLILLIYNIVRHPLTYVHYNEVFTRNAAQRVYELALQVKDSLGEAVVKVVDAIAAAPDTVSKISDYELQIYNAASKADLVSIPGDKLFGIFSLSGTPSEDFWSWMLLIPILAGVTGFITSWFSQKLNAATQDPSAAGSTKMMTYMMPIISVFFCYSLNCALGWYWIITNVLSIAQTYILHKMYDPKKALAEVEAKMEQEKAKKKEKRSAAAAKKAAAIAASKKKK